MIELEGVRERKDEEDVEKDMREVVLKREDEQRREKWRKLLWEAAGQVGPTSVSGENGRKTIVVLIELYSI